MQNFDYGVYLQRFDAAGNWVGSENGAVRLAGTLPTLRFGEVTAHDNEQWIVQAQAAVSEILVTNKY